MIVPTGMLRSNSATPPTWSAWKWLTISMSILCTPSARAAFTTRDALVGDAGASSGMPAVQPASISSDRPSGVT